MKNLLRIRYVFVIAVVFTLLNSIFFLINGVLESVHGFQIFFKKLKAGEPVLIGVYFMESLDRFLIAFVFLIFGLGIWKLFFLPKEHGEDLPDWLHIETFKDLKILLWETIMVTLVVFTISLVVKATSVPESGISSLGWNALVIPAMILILALALFFVRRK